MTGGVHSSISEGTLRIVLLQQCRSPSTPLVQMVMDEDRNHRATDHETSSHAATMDIQLNIRFDQKT